MTGIAVSGIGAGTIIIPPVMGRLISAYGWRHAYIITGISVLVLVIAIAQFLRRPAEAAPDARPGSSAPAFAGQTLREAARTRRFWATCGIFACSGFIAQSILVHLVPHATDLGVPAASAAGILSMVGGLSIIGRVVMGGAGDRTGARRALIFCFIIMLAGLLWLQNAGSLWGLDLFAVTFGFAYGGLIALMASTVAELFGLKAHGVLMGVTNFAATIGGAIGPLLAGRIFDVSGSYYVAFWVAAGVSLTGLALSAALRRRLRSVQLDS